MSLEPQGGGAVAGAGTFKVLGQAPTILVQGAGTVVDAMTITVQELTYGVVFSFTIPRGSSSADTVSWLGTGTQNAAALYAGYVQALGAAPEVVGLAYAQDVNAAGLLIDTMIVTVGTPDGLQTAIATVPLATANTPAAFQAIADAYSNLTAVAAAS